MAVEAGMQGVVLRSVLARIAMSGRRTENFFAFCLQ